LVGVEAEEAALRRDGDLVGEALFLPEPGQALLEAVLEGVGHRVELDVLVGLQRLRRSAGAAAAAADQADLQQVAAGGVGGAGYREGAAEHGGGFQEVAAGGGVVHESSWVRVKVGWSSRRPRGL